MCKVGSLFLSASIALAISGAAYAAETGGHDHGPHWSYSGEGGPESWGKLKEDFAVCGEGTQQSPIDISESVDAELEKIDVSYKPSALEIVNNGHTIQANYQPGSTIKIDDETYELAQFHYHAPSEHTVNGKSYPMEAHFVHKNAKGDLAVIGVFMEKGDENSAMKTVFENMPKEANSNKKLEAIKIDASKMLPSTASYFHYKGSLTTPPCAEKVEWYVLKKPVTLSDAQLNAFKSTVHANARPPQPTHRRFVLSSD